jgi:hypothetical protein
MERIKMTFSQFSDYLNNLKGCQFINLYALTDAKMYLRNNPYKGRVKKFNTVQLQFNYNYEQAVNNRLEREGKEPNFSTEKLPWGKWVFRNKVIAHNGELYMRTYRVRNSNEHTIYLLDGHLVSEEEMADIQKWLKPESTSSKQEEKGLEEELQVKPRTYQFDNIISVTLNHTRIMLCEE